MSTVTNSRIEIAPKTEATESENSLKSPKIAIKAKTIRRIFLSNLLMFLFIPIQFVIQKAKVGHYFDFSKQTYEIIGQINGVCSKHCSNRYLF